MKKFLCILLCLGIVFFCSCTAKDEAPAQQAEPIQEAEPVQEATAPSADQAEAPDPAQEATAQTGSYAPDFSFSVTDRNGLVYDESVFAEHELTMINFWEPWCGPCVGEMPDLQALYEAYADRGLLILGVYSTGGMEDDVAQVLDRTGVQYPILFATGGFEQFQSGYVPTTIFVDREGHVIHRELSPDERSAFSDVIQVLGEEQTSALYIGSNSYDGWAAIVEGLL